MAERSSRPPWAIKLIHDSATADRCPAAHHHLERYWRAMPEPPRSIMLLPAQLPAAPASAAIFGLDLTPAIEWIDLVVQFLHVSGADAPGLQQEKGAVEDSLGNRPAAHGFRHC